ncbi:MAG: hypothetical protein ABH804_02645 [archaeon]
MNLNTSILTIIVGILGILFGTLISPRVNQKLIQKYSRKELFFKKKLEYFEKIAENIENNIKIYKNSIMSSNNKTKKTKEIIKNLKEERKKFLISSSFIYLEKSKLSDLIKKFTNIEKNIFSDFNKLTIRKASPEIVSDLEKQLEILKKSGNLIILEMKNEIKKKL